MAEFNFEPIDFQTFLGFKNSAELLGYRVGMSVYSMGMSARKANALLFAEFYMAVENKPVFSSDTSINLSCCYRQCPQRFNPDHNGKAKHSLHRTSKDKSIGTNVLISSLHQSL